MLNNDDKSFLRKKLQNDITVPESLSAENIEKLIEGETQQKVNNKGTLRRFVAAAVAACLIITSLVFLSEGNLSFPNIFSGSSSTEETEAHTVSSYDGLIKIIKDYAEEYKNRVRNYNFLYSIDDKNEDIDFEIQEGAVINNAADSAASETKGNYGETNLRDENVKEADIFITDGEYIYSIDGYSRKLKITEAKADGTLEIKYSGEEASMSEDGNGDEIFYHELYKYENYLIVGFTKYTFKNRESKSGISGVMFYDITDKTAPVLVKEIALDGNFISSRITDGKLIFINSYSISSYFYGKDDSVLIPSAYNDGVKEYVPCDCILIPENEAAECYVNIAKIDLGNINGEIKTASFLGRAADTYCTKDTLYLMGTNYSYSNGGITFGAILLNAKTTLTAVDISGDNIKFLCSTELDGSVINSYAIDEYNGFIRIALQKDEENSILILNKKLEKISELKGIAKGEQIKSARFMGDSAYLVTFVQTDPLFVIDLSTPEKPEISGEVKLPGFSSYLHPVGDGLLAGIGYGGTESGVDGSSKISLFDVTEPTAPKEIDSLVFPESQLGTDPKAFCSVTENSFLVTFENWRMSSALLYEDEDARAYYIYTGALFVAVENKELVLKNAYLTKHINAVDRATFIEDKAYIFDSSYGSIASFDMNSEELICSVNAIKESYNFKPAEKTKEEIIF